MSESGDEIPPPESAPAIPRRVRVTAPAGAVLNLPKRGTPDPAAAFYVRSLIRSQLRIALSVALGFLLILMGLAVIVGTWPQIHDIRIGTFPLSWLLLGIGVYPLILLAAALYNRAATRIEDRYRSIARP
ncbi:hypothetical protein [Paeniglutamicibacter cryotolerans]|uniref:DUF485 domain-containing protein n=1 Tax=Paeniglutamicibacter cryotolerans TaxID=670079 RepID=A0A839QMY5_9MICC|nr:hypothetical protein [Paeniglutamicibacter cryotolerans]MBB2996124.1 hypothetical protein [Paeniglutamicibacter cryotolerans]